MKKQLKALKAMAEETGASLDDLMAEAEAGAMMNKPFIVAVSFNRMADLLAFAERVTDAGIGIYKADALDPEFPGRAGANRFVMRTIGGWHGKPEEWRVDNIDFTPADDDAEASF